MADYCAECGCPVNEHDDNKGACHALDLPERGHVNDCRCQDIRRRQAQDGRRARRDDLLEQIVDEDRRVLKRLDNA
ncbi:hypothetical protein H7J93_14680 [Mycobacterium barrassiae]|uniref:hypothetical protein n=1 Tax=Mycobacterium barrassiae TaxID=319709 RepID=UPI002265AC26|nr:hypothetical protein [Mycobacterium barrassiae]MCV7300869.1 hypothetical protein [Mycobacterium barrassiae]